MQVQDAPVGIHEIPNVLPTSGIAPKEFKVKAVVNAREPKSEEEVRRFMELVNFSAKFIPNLATAAGLL